MSNSVTFELEPDMIIGVELAISQLEEWVSLSYDDMCGRHSSISYSDYLKVINTHKATLRSMNSLRDYMLSLFGDRK